jgi:mRNA interferase MazF
VVSRGDIIWADLGGTAGRRPVCVLTRTSAIPVLNAVTCAIVTRTIRGIASEVVLDRGQMPSACVVNCDSIVRVPKAALGRKVVARLDAAQVLALDAALRFALDIT